MNTSKVMRLLGSAAALVVFLSTAAVSATGPATAAGAVSATATIDGRALAGATASHPVRLDPGKVTPIVMEVKNETAKPVSLRRVDFTGHVLGLNFFSYSTSVELTIAAGKTEKLTYRLDPAGLDGQATGLIGSDLTLIGSDGNPVTSVHTVIDVRGSLFSVYGLFGVIIAVLTGLAITDAALTVARHRLSVNRWQRGLRLLAPGIGLGLMVGFTASVARWWVPGTGLWLALAGVAAAAFFLIGYLSPTPRRTDDLGLDAEDLAAARELDTGTYRAAGAQPLRPGGTLTFPDPAHPPTYQDLEPATTAFTAQPPGSPDAATVHHPAAPTVGFRQRGPVFPEDSAGLDEPTIRHEPLGGSGPGSGEHTTVKRGPVRGVPGGTGLGDTTIGRNTGPIGAGGMAREAGTGAGGMAREPGTGAAEPGGGRGATSKPSLPTVRWMPGPPGSETDPDEPTIRDDQDARRGGVGG
ncbi:hypothetical protein [Nocardia inohanensis]|uniref:hypothetical protein n=1 Tax=Nocardia inohanensis TaxID=209246 RepID=UPI0008357046|nr:hypothetical protein [Nocardia inohanensis]